MSSRRFLLALVMVGAGLIGAMVPAAADPAPLCGSMAAATPHISKVMWIVMENRSYGTAKDQLPGSPSAPYIDNTLMAQCGVATNYHAVTHPSYPNYIAMTSGDTHGLTGDGMSYIAGPSIFSQADPSWRSYQEYMPAGCDHYYQRGTIATHQYYVGRHNPAASYSSLPLGAPSSGDCTSYDESLGTTTAGALSQDVASGTLPAFSFVTPGLCDDMHMLPTDDLSCPDTVKGGDSWLSTWIPQITSGPDYTSGNLLIDVVWDEARGGTSGQNCLTDQTAACIAPDIVISPYTSHLLSAVNLSHYSLLRTTERLLGLPYLGHAADPTTTDMCAPFNLCPAPTTPPPTAAFSASCTLLTCQLDGSASTAGTGSLAGYAWDFGDGTTGTGALTSHSYAASGTYPVTLTVTDSQAATGSVTNQVAVASGSPPISSIGASGVTGNSTRQTITVPAGAVTGSCLLLVSTSVGTAVPTAPVGWTQVGVQPNPVMTTVVWSRVAAATDAGSPVTVTYPATVKAAVQLMAYSGTSSTLPVAGFAAATSHVTATSATTPPVTVPAAGDEVVSAWAAKSSAITAWVPPAGAVVRNAAYGTGGGQISALVTDPGVPLPAGPVAGLTATANQPSSAQTALSVVLAVGP